MVTHAVVRASEWWAKRANGLPVIRLYQSWCRPTSLCRLLNNLLCSTSPLLALLSAVPGIPPRTQCGIPSLNAPSCVDDRN